MNQHIRSHSETIQLYDQHIKNCETAIQQLRKTKNILALARMLIVSCGVVSCWYFWPSLPFVIPTLLFFSLIFIFVVFKDADKTAAIRHQEKLLRVNQHELDAMQQNLHAYDDGRQFSDSAHPYAADLDLFGPASIFQFLNRCHADQSKKLLADYLKTAMPVAAIKEKQAAVKELSVKQKYSQLFQVTALANPLTDATEKKLKECLEAPATVFQHSFWKWFQHIYPVISLLLLGLFIVDRISWNAFLICMIVFYVVSYLLSRKILPAFDMLGDTESEMDALYNQIVLIETEKFESSFLQSLKTRLRTAGYATASASIRDFNRIIKKNDWRSNLLINFILQVFFVWDLRLIILLNEWKKKNGQPFAGWFGIVAEMEVTISLASLAFNEPGWCFPQADDHYFHFNAQAIGHPLIPGSTRVTSDFSLEGTGKIALVTGSNMAGKSTFLRSLGVNTILALTGSPACAVRFNLSTVKLVTSMRIADNLSESTSTFYAELKKLQYIIESVNRHEPVFILLDEVLRGTNSADRHKGSRALVRQLLQSNAVTVMATHDTELAHAESTGGSVANYHFEGKIIDDELLFDYKIKNGICESLNATTLMKKIGIHFQD
jgi:MutS domain V